MIAPHDFAHSDDGDAQIMARIRDGRIELFDDLMRRNEDRVVKLISRLRGSTEDSDDLSQQVFMKVFRARHRYEPTAKFTTWLYTITRNVVFNDNRQSSRRREVGLRIPRGRRNESPVVVEIAVQTDPVDEVTRLNTRHAVRQAIDSLSTRQRTAILLVHFRGYSYRAAAAELAITEKALKSLVQRARCNLRQLLESAHGTGLTDMLTSAPSAPSDKRVSFVSHE